MASTAMFSLYASWGQYDNPVVYDEDSSVALSSFRRLEFNQPPLPSPIPPPASNELPLPLTPVSELKCKQNFNEKHKTHDIIINNNNNNNNPETRSFPFNIDKNVPAVEVINAQYSFGLSKNSVIALRGVNLTVPAGGIYGLLGPSGCGKTTLLRCMVGQIKPDKGKIKVFGFSPGSRGSLVPGPGIGYMPQELALFPDFTIEETLVYFGRLYRMKSSHVHERIKFLLKFLDLPSKDRMIGNLSGGQKRRVSLAAALVHSPPLLILDEPTVGVDPVLRQAIWDHLVSLTKDGNLTVLITTHYIEEARAANMVGLMRFGRLLTEASPEFLLKHFDSPTLEEVFLKLCQIDVSNDTTERLNKLKRKRFMVKSKPDICNDVIMNGNGEKNGVLAGQGAINKAFSNSHEVLDDVIKEKNNFGEQNQSNKEKSNKVPLTKANVVENVVGSLARTSALFHKNLIRLRRNLPVLMFQFLLPSLEVILFCVCIGRDPFDLKVAVVNEEKFGIHGKSFLKSIDSHTIQQGMYNTTDDAIQAVKDGNSWAAVVVGENFSYALTQRALQGPDVSNETIEQSEIKVHLDMTNQIIAYQLQRTLLESFQKFSRNLVSLLDISPSIAELPVKMSNPVYGDEHPTFTEFMAPGVLLSIAFLAAVALTALAFVLERKEGLLERSLVAGVTSHEFLLSHVLTQLLVLFVQVVFLLVFTFAVFKIPSRGSFIWVISLTFLQGACGMSYGLMISAICKEENSATMLALGSFYPNLLLSGTVWPTQAMPVTMRYISYLLPQTLPVEAMRSILSRGWDITHPEVALGFGVTLLWSIFFLLAAVIIFKYKK